ncbi:MAG TPA: alginate export family protein [Terriglobia bacterium]|nr:alginate export family protein [Terriglobia bacterium]
MIDAANGRTVIPGLNDSHMHPIREGLNYTMELISAIWVAFSHGKVVSNDDHAPGVEIGRQETRFSAKADISTGDHPNSNTLGTFNPLFPKGNYFGVLATVGPGPLNFIDIHPRIEGTFPYEIAASFDWIVYWRQSLVDGVYSVPGSLIRAADGSRARFVGHRPGTEVRWQVNTHLWFQGDFGIFYAGRFLKETKPGCNLNYWALCAGYKF